MSVPTSSAPGMAPTSAPGEGPPSEEASPGGSVGLAASRSTNTNGAFSTPAGGLPKLREILRRQKQDSEDDDSPDIDFLYEDSDSLSSELAEFYSYTENPEFPGIQKAFEDCTKKFNLPSNWKQLELSQREQVLQNLLDQCDSSSKTDRLEASTACLYLAQGCWLECQSDSECLELATENVVLMYKFGAYAVFTELLNLEMENSEAAASAMRKMAVSLADSTELRVLLGLLYIMTEILRRHSEEEIRESFRDHLLTPIDDDLFVTRLLSMVTRFCSGTSPHFPMKKVLLLLWKVLLTSLGGMSILRELKSAYRAEASLPAVSEDTLTVSRHMRAASPPASAADILDATNNRRNNGGGGGGGSRPGIKRSMMTKQSSLDDVGLDLEGDEEDFEDASSAGGGSNAEEEEEEEEEPEEEELRQRQKDFQQPDSPRPGTPVALPANDLGPRSLPWTPKVRPKDIDHFLEYTRTKFVGFTLENDRTTLAGLPQPIHEGVAILKKHVYESMAELQIEREEDLARHPMSRPEGVVRSTPAEQLYQAMLPSLPQYMIALLKILLAAAPTSKAKTDSINIMTDVLPEEMPMTVMQSMKLGIDVNRHKEIIVKSVSAVLLLLLKHFKVNHVYQFEFMSQHLVFANCIPLVLKFFNQNIMAYIASKNNIALLDFPSCVIGEQPELTAETLEIGDSPLCCWRNMFSCINLLRVLNKLTKWKHSRIMMLVVFKSAPILKRTLKVKHAMLQLYVLKLLKMQTKYLGRQWRKSNMKTMSAIYTKVRHRLNDDWAFGNDVDSRPWDFQAEECALRSAVDRFNHRRYDRGIMSSGSAEKPGGDASVAEERADFDMEPVDNCLTSVLGKEFELTDEFKQNYEKWLSLEVYNMEIQWELLLENNNKK